MKKDKVVTKAITNDAVARQTQRIDQLGLNQTNKEMIAAGLANKSVEGINSSHNTSIQQLSQQEGASLAEFQEGQEDSKEALGNQSYEQSMEQLAANTSSKSIIQPAKSSLNPHQVESWLNEMLEMAAQRKVKNALPNDGRTPLERYVLSKLELTGRGAQLNDINELYDMLYQSTKGFMEIVEKTMAGAGGDAQIVKSAYNVFGVLAETILPTNFELVEKIMKLNFEEDVAKVTEEYKRHHENTLREVSNRDKEIEDLNKKIKKQNGNMINKQLIIEGLNSTITKKDMGYRIEVDLRMQNERQCGKIQNVLKDMESKTRTFQERLENSMKTIFDKNEMINKLREEQSKIMGAKFGIDQENNLNAERVRVLEKNNIVLASRLEKAYAKLDRVKGEISDMGDLTQQLIKTSLELKLSTDALTSERDTCKHEATIMVPQLEAAKVDLKEAQDRIKSLEAEIAEQREVTWELEQEHVKVQESDALAQRRLMELTRNANKLTKRANEAEIEAETLKLENEKLIKSHEIMEKEHKQSVKRVKECTDARRIAEEHEKVAKDEQLLITADNTKLKTEVETVQFKNTKLEDETLDQEEIIRGLEGKIKKDARNAEKFKATVREKENSFLDLINVEQKKVVTLNSKLNERETTIHDQDRIIKENETSIAGLKNIVQGMREKLEGVTDNLYRYSKDKKQNTLMISEQHCDIDERGRQITALRKANELEREKAEIKYNKMYASKNLEVERENRALKCSQMNYEDLYTRMSMLYRHFERKRGKIALQKNVIKNIEEDLEKYTKSNHEFFELCAKNKFEIKHQNEMIKNQNCMMTELRGEVKELKRKYEKKSEKLYKERNRTPEEPVDRSVLTLEAKIQVLEEQVAYATAVKFAMRARETQTEEKQMKNRKNQTKMKLSNFVKKKTVVEEGKKTPDPKKTTPAQSPVEDEKQQLLYQSQKRYTQNLMENAPNADVGTSNLGSFAPTTNIAQHTGIKSQTAHQSPAKLTAEAVKPNVRASAGAANPRSTERPPTISVNDTSKDPRGISVNIEQKKNRGASPDSYALAVEKQMKKASQHVRNRTMPLEPNVGINELIGVPGQITMDGRNTTGGFSVPLSTPNANGQKDRVESEQLPNINKAIVNELPRFSKGYSKTPRNPPGMRSLKPSVPNRRGKTVARAKHAKLLNWSRDDTEQLEDFGTSGTLLSVTEEVNNSKTILSTSLPATTKALEEKFVDDKKRYQISSAANNTELLEPNKSQEANKTQTAGFMQSPRVDQRLGPLVKNKPTKKQTKRQVEESEESDESIEPVKLTERKFSDYREINKKGKTPRQAAGRNLSTSPPKTRPHVMNVKNTPKITKKEDILPAPFEMDSERSDEGPTFNVESPKIQLKRSGDPHQSVSIQPQEGFSPIIQTPHKYRGENSILSPRPSIKASPRELGRSQYHDKGIKAHLRSANSRNKKDTNFFNYH